MAGKQIDVNLSVNDNGGTLKKRNEEAKELNRNLTRAADLAQKALKPAAGYQAKGEGTEYGRARGSMGTTGASARDFANQAQGLGGLVRIYATVAANLFAVSAAFNALKEAANTTNMVKGMDQLGAASGVALGTMAKRFAEATDNAISLREAMGSVTKASAAGLSSKQILEIGQYAKTASQALGLDMTDAVSRLTRGITKLEPELLDELGLFTKIGPAADRYALKLGKTAASLTDFERRQAFANAVLEEARIKFGELDLPANPYQKLEASVRNLATAGLELINKFLIPLVQVFTNNSGLLIGALGAIALKLTGMAIPALTSWRGELVRAAKDAKDRARDITEAFGETSVTRTLASLDIPKLEKDLNTAKQKVIQTQKDLANIEKQTGLSRKAGTLAQSAAFGQDPKDLAAAQRTSNELIKKGTQDTVAYGNAIKAAKEAKKEELRLQQQLNVAQDEALKLAERGSIEENLRRRISRQAGARAERLSILSQVSGNLEIGGFRYAIDELNKGVNKAADLTAWDKLRTRATGWGIAFVSQVGMVMRAFNGLMVGLAVGGVVLAALDAIFSKNAAEVADFNNQLSNINTTVTTSANVMKKYGEAITVASLNARATSFKQLADDLDDLTVKLENALERQSGWDRFKDFVKDLFNFGLRTDFADAAAKDIAQQLKNIPEGPVKEALKLKIATIAGAIGASEEEIAKGLGKLDAKEAAKRVKEISKEAKPFLTEQLKIADAANQVKAALDDANLKASELFQTLQSGDKIIKFGDSVVTLGLKLREAFKDAKSGAASLEAILSKSENQRIISPESFKQLLDIQDAYSKAAIQADKYSVQVAASRERVADLEADEARLAKRQGIPPEVLNQLKQERLKEFAKLTDLEIKLQIEESSVKQLEVKLGQISVDTIRRGYDLMFKQANLASERARLATQRGLLEGTSSAGAIQAQGAITVKEIDIQLRQIDIVSRLNDTMMRNNMLMEEELAIRGQTQIEERAKKEGRYMTPAEQLESASLYTRQMELQQLRSIPKISQKLAESITDPVAAGLAQKAVGTQIGTQEQRSVLLEQRRNAEIQTRLKAEEAVLKTKLEQDKASANLQKLELERAELALSSYEYLSDTQILAKQALETQNFLNDRKLAEKAIENDITGLTERKKYADAATRAGLDAEIKLKETQLAQLKQEKPILEEILQIKQRQAIINNYYMRENMLRENAATIAQLDRDIQMGRIESELELLGIRSQINLMLPDELAANEKRLKSEALLAQQQDQLAKAEKTKADAMAKIAQDEAIAKAANADYDQSLFMEREMMVDRVYNKELQKIRQTNEAKQQAIDLQYSLTDRMKTYDQTFQKAFEGMADAIVEFAKTGKLNFKDLINSMLEDLLRYELRMQALMMYQAFRPGIMGFLGNLIPSMFGGSPAGAGAGGPSFGGPGGIYPMVPMKAAKGAAFDTGLRKFAKGGMFTNKIVTEPTLFKFAQGAGLMGEAGPEAIMPLKRDGQGNLGVRTTQQQPKVDVVVNNFSGEKAETMETVDSKGNRKIEVVIGEMVASEVGRKNSPMQQSISANFMTRPAMTRR